jgi:16S rRNA C967 or C1407 C5-methylase (RsmB/RsmF family)/NOL1/NOP2/fmu family ribosome biogenesis protein
MIFDNEYNKNFYFIQPKKLTLPLLFLNSLEGINGFNRSTFESVHASGEQVTSIRLNPVKQTIAQQNLFDEAIPWCKNAFYLKERPSFTLDPTFHAGAYYVQEASSMFLWHVVEQLIGADTKGKKVLDLCAAPGGKSTLLASYFLDGLVIANEIIKSRASILVENCIKWGLPNMIVTNNDPDHFKPLEGFFDLIVVDAPCSGSGLFRKDPQAIEEWSLANVQHCSQRQEKILDAILPSLKEDGILIYSTCSYSKEEDEQIADWLIENKEMISLKIEYNDQWKIIESTSNLKGAYGYRFYPDQIKGEGFFIAAFKKKGSSFSPRYKETQLTKPNKSELDLMNQFFMLPSSFNYFKQNDALRIINLEWWSALQQIAATLYIKKAGIEIGTIKGKDIIPSHELAVSTLDKTNFSQIEVTKEQSLQYIRRKELSIDAPKGWCLVKYLDAYLGWIKVLPNRINNYYPAEWRILKD